MNDNLVTLGAVTHTHTHTHVHLLSENFVSVYMNSNVNACLGYLKNETKHMKLNLM